jgi:hypothetical protein
MARAGATAANGTARAGIVAGMARDGTMAAAGVDTAAGRPWAGAGAAAVGTNRRFGMGRFAAL